MTFGPWAARRFGLRVRIALPGSTSYGGSMKPIASLLAVAAVVACSDSFKPTTDNVLGNYAASTFTTTDSTGTKDWIVAGASLELLLGAQGITVGTLSVPGAGPGGTNVLADMTGTWELTGNTVHFTQNDDTFVRDIDWVASENRLSGDATFSGKRIRVVLTKQP